MSGSGGAESQDRMRDSPAPSSASSSVTDLYCTPHSSRSDLFLPGTAGDFSLSASLSACTLLYEVPSRTGGPGASERAREGGAPPPAGPGQPAQDGRPRRLLPAAARALPAPCRALLAARRKLRQDGGWGREGPVGGPWAGGPRCLLFAPEAGGGDGARAVGSAAAGLARGGVGRGPERGGAGTQALPDRIPPGTWHRGQSPTQGTVRVSRPSWAVRFECQGGCLCCRGLWSPCRSMWTPRKTRRTHPMSTTWWRTPPW